jgi:hypothetical protein
LTRLWLKTTRPNAKSAWRWEYRTRGELGQRLPTEEQTRVFARFFNVSFEELEAKRFAERFWSEHGDSPAIGEAAALIMAAASKLMRGRTSSEK